MVHEKASIVSQKSNYSLRKILNVITVILLIFVIIPNRSFVADIWDTIFPSSDNILYGKTATSLYALRMRDGSLLWQTNDVVDYRPTPKGIILVRSQSIEYRDTSNSVRWSQPISSDSQYSILGDTANVLYLGERNKQQGALSAINMQTGRQLWRFALEHGYPTNIQIDADQQIVVGSAAADDSSGIYVISSRDGKQLRYQQFAGIFTISPVLIQNGILYLHANYRYTYALELADWRIVWRSPISRIPYHYPVILAHEIIQVDPIKSEVDAYSTVTFTQQWSRALSTIDDDKLVLIDPHTVGVFVNHSLTALNVDTSTVLWKTVSFHDDKQFLLSTPSHLYLYDNEHVVVVKMDSKEIPYSLSGSFENSTLSFIKDDNRLWITDRNSMCLVDVMKQTILWNTTLPTQQTFISLSFN